MPKNTNRTKKSTQILISQHIPRLKKLKQFQQNLKFAFLNLLPKFYSNNEA